MFDLAPDQELALIDSICDGLAVYSVAVFVVLYWFIPSPWGKSLQSAWWMGPHLPARWSWFLFESPNLIWCAIAWRYGRADLPLPNLLLFLLFLGHYIRRDIVYPLKMSPKTKPIPLVTVLAAISFCCVNG